MDGRSVSKFKFVTWFWVLFWEGHTLRRSHASFVMHHWLGRGWRRLDFSLTSSMVVISSTLALLVGMVEGHCTNRLRGWPLIPSPTLSRCMIMGNSFNCLTIIDYIGGRALDLESRRLDTWLHTFLAEWLWGKPLSLSSLRFFSYIIMGIISSLTTSQICGEKIIR